MTNPGKDVRAGHEWKPWNSISRFGRCSCGQPIRGSFRFTQWQVHVASLPAQEPAEDDYTHPSNMVDDAHPADALASQVPAQPPAQKVINTPEAESYQRLQEIGAAPASPQIADGLEQECRKFVLENSGYGIETLTGNLSAFIRTKLRAALAESDTASQDTLEQQARELSNLILSSFPGKPEVDAMTVAIANFTHRAVRAALAESEPCGHLRANVFGDDYGHPYCSVCEAMKRARAEALEEAAKLAESDPPRDMNWSWNRASVAKAIRALAAQPTPAPKERK